MTILKFHRRDRRQRDPFAGTPLDRKPVPAGWNAHGWPLVRDAAGVRPATGGEMTVPATTPAPRFPDPHGVATDETLAGIAAQAYAETQALPRRTFTDREAVAAGFRARAAVQRDIPTAVLPALRAWTPIPPGKHRAASAPPPVTLPPPPVTAAESASRMARLAYPPPGADRDRYAAVMRQVSAYTGTRTAFDLPSAWTAARPAPAEAPVTHWMPQRPARLALPAGTEVAA